MCVCVYVCMSEEEIVEVKFKGFLQIIIIFSTLLTFLFKSTQIKVFCSH
jgi:hypothetical protein